jgi:hypothetical protein
MLIRMYLQFILYKYRQEDIKGLFTYLQKETVLIQTIISYKTVLISLIQ